MNEQAMITVDNIDVNGPDSNIYSYNSEEKINDLIRLGVLSDERTQEVRGSNVGESDYSKHYIQPWSIWLDYNLDPWDADIIKRVLRTKSGESKVADYEKIIHICKEKIRQYDYK